MERNSIFSQKYLRISIIYCTFAVGMNSYCNLNALNIMAQATMTVRTDAALKATFDSLCAQFGMSANTAMNIFMRAVAETRSIPFVIGKRGDTTPEIRYQQALERLHQDAIHRNEPELTLDEINAEITAYRAERAARNKTQAV